MPQRPIRYCQITHAQRIQAIYLRTVHGLTLSQIERLSKIKYHSIRSVLRAYQTCGRTNKLGRLPTKPLAPSTRRRRKQHFDHSKSGLFARELQESARLSQEVRNLEAQKQVSAPASGETTGSSRLTPRGFTDDVTRQGIDCRSLARRCTLRMVLDVDSNGVEQGHLKETSSIKEEEPLGIESLAEVIPTDISNYENLNSARIHCFSGQLEGLNVLTCWQETQRRPLSCISDESKVKLEQILQPLSSAALC